MVDISWSGRAELFTEFVGAEVSRKRCRPPAYAAVQQPEGKSRGGAGDLKRGRSRSAAARTGPGYAGGSGALLKRPITTPPSPTNAVTGKKRNQPRKGVSPANTRAAAPITT